MTVIILDAIQNRAVLSFTYSDKPRLVEPHAYGITHNGNAVLRAWEIDQGWKLFSIDKITDLNITPTLFHTPRPNFNPNDKQMEVVHAHIS